MTLEETIKKIKYDLEGDAYTDFHWGKDIRTLINYIENESMPKEIVKKAYEDYAERIKYIDDNNFVQDDTYHEYIKICDVLLRLLGDDNQ